jgi:hypothetical protein
MREEHALEWANRFRDQLMREARDATAPLGAYLAYRKKPVSPTAAELIEKKGLDRALAGVGRSNAPITRTMAYLRVGGNVILLAGAAVTAHDIASAPSVDKWRVLARESSGFLGATAGAWAGGRTGGRIGMKLGGPRGAAVGGVAGSVIGGIVGGVAAATGGDYVYEYTVPDEYR